MAGRWSCVALVVVLVVACRTPKKEVSIYPLDDDESGNARHRHTSSDAGNAVTGRVELPNYAGTETATNSTVVAAPATNNTPTAILPPANTKPPVADKLPAPATVKTEALHLKSSELPPMAAPTNTTAHLGLPGLSGSQSFAPVSQPIHLSLPAWTTPNARETAGLAVPNVNPSPAVVPRQLPTRVNMPVNISSNSSSAADMAQTVTLPAVGAAATNAVDALSKPVDLEPLLDGVHDEAWRQRQADQQRAAESARQSERDSLEKTLQRFLQPASK